MLPMVHVKIYLGIRNLNLFELKTNAKYTSHD